MRKIADGVWQFSGFPKDMFNVYLVGDVLIDAASRWAGGRLLRQLGCRKIKMVALTHCHPDHQGVAKFMCERFRVPLACHEADAPIMEGRAAMVPDNAWVHFSKRVFAGPPHRVEKVLRDGDELAGFRVVHAPGHTPGHVIFFRESDRLAIAGDVLANIHFITWKPGLREPPPFFSFDATQNRKSIHLLMSLEPAIVCFGHGPPLRDTELLKRFVKRRQ